MKNIPAFMIGALFTIVGILMIVKRVKQQQNNTASTKASIIDYIEDTSYDADTGTQYSYFPVVQYYVDGKTYQKKTDIGYAKRKFPIGSEIEIKYNPNNPDDFNLANSPATWIFPIAITIMGLVVMIFML